MHKNKGAHLLVEALRILSNKPVTLLTLGEGASLPEIPGVHWHHLGNVNHQRTVALAYCAADLMVHPSIADTLPNVAIESIACGTPVLGYKIGGVPEIVRPNLTGWLAPELSAESFAGALDAAISQIQQGLDLRESCRVTAEKEYSQALQATRYVQLFENLLQ